MTYTRHAGDVVDLVVAVASIVVAVVTAAWAVQPSMGPTMWIGAPLITAAAIWWRWSLPPTAPRLWIPTGLILVMLAILAVAGYESAGSRGLEQAGQVGWAVLTVFFYTPALVVATKRGALTSPDSEAT
ncbi:hypothetical protein [Nocardiopsis dassonvillei]|uniref:hypothetical protein n=1 Tax=Nocardiopsis dassonvillei TaxID=2014 RepID=UPI003F57CA9D